MLYTYSDGDCKAGLPKYFNSVCVLTFLFLMGSGCGRAESPQSKSPAGPNRWTHVELVGSYSFEGDVIDNKNLSGIAVLSASHGLIGADESDQVQVLEMSRAERTLKMRGAVSLLGSGDEIDIEGIAAEDDCYYIVGSHGVAKKSGERQAKRYTICRLQADPITGLPVQGGENVSAASLADILSTDAMLGPYFGKPLQQKGVNIEGLAIRKGQLFVGLRNPNLDGNAFVVQVAANDVFAGGDPPAYTLHKLQLGRGLGIREIVAASTGFLLIAGNAGSEPSDVYPEAQDYEEGRDYTICWWDGKGAVVHKIGVVAEPSGKAEAMLILEQTDAQAMVLILFDGPKQGKPSVYRLY